MAATSNPIRTLTVDDHPLLREGIAALIATHADLEMAAEASNGHEAIEQFRVTRPDVALRDLQLPGIDAIIMIRGEFPSAKIVVLTTYSGDGRAQRALKAGAPAYVL